MEVTNKEIFLKEFYEKGYVIIEDAITNDYINRAKSELDIALQNEVEYMGTKDYKFYGYVLSNAKYGGAFLEIFDNKNVVDPINWIMGNNSIIYSYTSSSMPPNMGNDSSHVHVDCPIFIQDYILRMGVLLPLDDFTVENGATYFLEGSHKSERKPSDEEFYKNAKRLIIKAGSAWFFNTRMWHAGGNNITSNWRHALTINVCRPWMKQYIDTPRLLSDVDLNGVSDNVLQKLGFFSQPPASYEEYYDKTRKRLF